MLGYGPKAAKERVRVAMVLDELPLMHDALATGEQSYSAIKELTRVAVAKTQAEWLAAARGKNVRQIEDLVAHRRPGSYSCATASAARCPDVARRGTSMSITSNRSI